MIARLIARWRRWRFDRHVHRCHRCRPVVERDAPAAYLCARGNELGRGVYLSKR